MHTFTACGRTVTVFPAGVDFVALRFGVVDQDRISRDPASEVAADSAACPLLDKLPDRARPCDHELARRQSRELFERGRVIDVEADSHIRSPFPR